MSLQKVEKKKQMILLYPKAAISPLCVDMFASCKLNPWNQVHELADLHPRQPL